MPTTFDKLSWSLEHTCKAILKFEQRPTRFTLQLLLTEIDLLQDLAQTCLDSLQYAAIDDSIDDMLSAFEDVDSL